MGGYIRRPRDENYSISPTGSRFIWIGGNGYGTRKLIQSVDFDIFLNGKANLENFGKIMMVTVEKLVEGLCLIPDEEFTCENIYQFLGENPVDVNTITQYFYWSKNFYTRNLIYKDERFEMMAICWEKGQVSRVHNHSEQKCWMTVPVGKLRGQNFRVLDIDEKKGYCKLEETDRFYLSDCLAAKVELEEPIHQVLNLPEFNERAVSIHIYSKPYDKCLSYCRDTDTFKEVPLFYTSIDGKLCDGINL